MARSASATALWLGLCAAVCRPARVVSDAESLRVAVVAQASTGWRGKGLARATGAHLARAARLVPANPSMASRLVPADGAAPEAKVAAAARLLRAQYVVVVSEVGAGRARARLFDVAAVRWTPLEASGALHDTPGSLALAAIRAMGLDVAQADAARIAKRIAADEAAIEAMWQGDNQADPHEQLRYYRRAVHQDPASAAAHNQVGTALARLGRHRQALDAFSRALALQADSVAAHTNRGLVLRRQERWDEAEQAFRRAIELGTKSPSPYIGLARLLDRKGATREAVEQLERAVELDPSHLSALMTLADIYFAQHRAKAARRCVDRMLALEREHVPALNLLGLLQLVPRDYEASEATLRKALAIEPRSAPTLANLGLALYGQERVGEAIATLERAITLDRRSANAHFYLGRIHLQEHHYDEAVAALERAVEFAPHMLAARRSLEQARRARRSRGGGCGCAPFAGASSRFADRLVGPLLPVALLLAPHAVGLARRRRRR